MICLTFDIEERFHSHLTPDGTKPHWQLYDRVSHCLDWISEHNEKATFFVVGEFAERYPDLVRRMVDLHCEVASHTFSHLRMDKDNAQNCLADITRSKKLLEDITGQPVYGFRAPSWTARLKDHWLWDHLVDLGFVYDTSLFPFKTNLYGSTSYHVFPYWIRPELLEIPPAVFKLGPLRIPYSGGFYFRLCPLWLTRLLISTEIKRDNTPVLYFHPWDFEHSPIMLEKGIYYQFIANYNVSGNWNRFKSLLKDFHTCTCFDYYKSLERQTDSIR